MSGIPSRWNIEESTITDVDEFGISSLQSTPSLKPYQDALDHTLKTSKEAGLADIYVPTSFGRFLQLQVQLMMLQNDGNQDKPFNILEIGGLGGYSAIWFASAGNNIHVTSVEYAAKNVEVARANMDYAGLSNRVKYIHGAGMDVLPRVKDEVLSGQRPKFDFVFIDADRINSWNYFALARDMVRKGACLVVDNVAGWGRLIDDEMYKKGDGWAVGNRELVQKVGKDQAVEGMLMQTVDAGGWDGYVMAVKT